MNFITEAYKNGNLSIEKLNEFTVTVERKKFEFSGKFDELNQEAEIF